MKIYYIAVSSWDGSHYTFDYIRQFLSEQKRDEALAKMKESRAHKKGDIVLYAEEDEVEDAPKEDEK